MSTAVELLRGFRAGELSPVEVTAEVNARVEAVDPAVNAVRTPTAELAAAQARESLRRYRTGTARPLEGVPYVVKDLFDTAGVPTGYGSRLFDGHVPNRDAAAVARVRAAGAVLIGKVTTHEFGWGYTTGSEHWGPTRNPWSPDRIPGGSSGGSAAALAAGLGALALGSDTGGSIRVPSAFCGVTGFKPTFGRVNAAGAFPLAPSLDHAGPMARDPADAALLFSVLTDLAGELPGGDVGAWIASLRRAQEDPGRRPLAGMTVGVLTDAGGPVPVPAVLGAVASAARRLADLGATVVPVDPPGGSTAFEAFTPILLAEALAIHRERGLLPARRAEYGSDVQARIAMAEALDPAEVAGARARRSRLGEQLTRLFTQVDLLLGPVAAGPPPKVGEKLVPMRLLLHPWIAAQNLAGLPACALPEGFDDAGLPVGIQLTGRPGADTRVLEVAAALYGGAAGPPRWPAI